MKNYEVRGFHFTENNSKEYIFFAALPDLERGNKGMGIFKIFPIVKDGIHLLVVILRHKTPEDTNSYSHIGKQIIVSKRAKLPSKFVTLPADKKIGVVTVHEQNISLHSPKNQKIFEKAIANGFINDPSVISANGFYNPSHLKTFIENNASSNKENLNYAAIDPLETGNGGTVDPIP